MSIRVLIVDDDVAIRQSVADTLGDMGVTDISYAENGAAGLEAMRARKPDLVILDVRMPVMDGLAFRQEMLADDDLLDVQVAVCTGKRMSHQEVQVLMPHWILPKPIQLGEIETVVEEATARAADAPQRRRAQLAMAIARSATIRGDMEAFEDRLRRRLAKMPGSGEGGA